MNDLIKFTGMKPGTMIAIAAAIILSAAPAWSHGGKSHGGTGFSSLQAVQKATELYDRLIDTGKLNEEWETGLRTINVSTRQTSGGPEYVIRFSREEGDPENVYFFFDQQGEYAGSNFTGQ